MSSYGGGAGVEPAFVETRNKWLALLSSWLGMGGTNRLTAEGVL